MMTKLRVFDDFSGTGKEKKWRWSNIANRCDQSATSIRTDCYHEKQRKTKQLQRSASSKGSVRNLHKSRPGFKGQWTKRYTAQKTSRAKNFDRRRNKERSEWRTQHTPNSSK
jgi:hypothetical protein